MKNCCICIIIYLQEATSHFEFSVSSIVIAVVVVVVSADEISWYAPR